MSTLNTSSTLYVLEYYLRGGRVLSHGDWPHAAGRLRLRSPSPHASIRSRRFLAAARATATSPEMQSRTTTPMIRSATEPQPARAPPQAMEPCPQPWIAAACRDVRRACLPVCARAALPGSSSPCGAHPRNDAALLRTGAKRACRWAAAAPRVPLALRPPEAVAASRAQPPAPRTLTYARRVPNRAASSRAGRPVASR